MARLTKDHPKGSWSPSINDQMQYLELNFGKPERLDTIEWRMSMERV